MSLECRSQGIKDGTSLWAMPKKVNKSNISQHLIIFSCQHAGQAKELKKEWITDKLQFVQGKLQAEAMTNMCVHDIASWRNRNHCTVYKRNNSNIDPNIGNRKRNKTQSKKCNPNPNPNQKVNRSNSLPIIQDAHARLCLKFYVTNECFAHLIEH